MDQKPTKPLAAAAHRHWRLYPHGDTPLTGFALPEHIHEHATICLTLAGRFVEVMGPDTYDCSPASLLFKPARQVHANRYGERGARCLIVEIKQEQMGDGNYEPDHAPAFEMFLNQE